MATFFAAPPVARHAMPRDRQVDGTIAMMRAPYGFIISKVRPSP